MVKTAVTKTYRKNGKKKKDMTNNRNDGETDGRTDKQTHSKGEQQVGR